MSGLGSRSDRNSSLQGGYRNRRLPDKLRIVKPLEGSLTLHQWSRLATPHLGGVLEERVGVAVKGNLRHGLDPLFDMYQLSELEEDNEELPVRPNVTAQTFNTLTNSTVLHPDTTTFCTKSYGRSQMSSGVPSRAESRCSSRHASMHGSFTDLPSLLASHNNIGLSKLLGDKKISSARRSQLDLSAMSAILSHKLLIMEAVEEVGVENMFMDKEDTPMSMPELSEASMPRTQTKKPVPQVTVGLGDFDARFLGALDDFDELKDITPGMLTLTGEAPRDPLEYTEQWIGQLTVPSFSSAGRPSLQCGELGRVPTPGEAPSSPVCGGPRLGGR